MRLNVLAVGRLKAGPERELYDRYAERIASRPAFQRINAADDEMAAQHAAAAGV